MGSRINRVDQLRELISVDTPTYELFSSPECGNRVRLQRELIDKCDDVFRAVRTLHHLYEIQTQITLEVPDKRSPVDLVDKTDEA